MTNAAQRGESLDKIARAMMDARPDLEQMSLDEWLLTHNDKLTVRERQAAYAILCLYDE
ncbi:hypothetical protein HJA82_29520 [Rhizobium bangladeshense]|uniref:hypothetical protein n=1 Tax=Rhizobium bangladeshense TaxID=1138189 RepID=UPI001C82B577|nr:hypothetical protein [Rhizobium bangladeshense]MBX4911456.1 hypothetical protein [Rhizobium bangladeshense]